MKTNKRVIILSAKPYGFKNENGELLSGQTLHLIETDNLSPIKQDDGTYGYVPLKTSVPGEVAENLETIPAVYDADFVLKSDPKKGILAKITSLSFVSGISESV